MRHSETAIPTTDGADVEVDGEKIHIPADLFEVRDEIIDVRGEDIVPHVIEPSYGIDRMCYAVLEQAYDEDTADGENRVVMRLFPESRTGAGRGLPAHDPRRSRYDSRRDYPHPPQKGILAEYDDSGAIGRRYRRQDEIGTPFAVTVDYDTREQYRHPPRPRQHEAGADPDHKTTCDCRGSGEWKYHVRLSHRLTRPYEPVSVIP